jgi:hypothetical protein
LSIIAGAGFAPSVVSNQIPTTSLPGVPSVNNAGVLGNFINSFPLVGQYYFNVPFPNNQVVLYKLQLYDDYVNNIDDKTEYIFPLSPSSVTKQSVNLTTYYDVDGGGRSTFGVQRIIDHYGMTPPTISISGTTGFQFHSLDGFQWSGKSSFAKLVQMIASYAEKVNRVKSSSQNKPMPTMVFTDGFTGEVFLVIPMGPQNFSMEAAHPIYQNYNIQLLVAASLGEPEVAKLDAISKNLIELVGIKASLFLTYWNSLLISLPTGLIT